MKPIIIGIHGLKNKAPKEILSQWWQAAIREGLRNFFVEKDVDFELVYWADLNYKKPLNPSITDENDPLYLTNPYVPGDNNFDIPESTEIRKKLLDALEKGMDKLFLQENSIVGIDQIADLAIRRMFIDLDTYYHGNCRIPQNQEAKDAYHERLADILQKHHKRRIMLIAHSMGCIISYDTLTQLIPKLKIDTFITLGCPLGNSIVLKKIMQEQNLEIDEDSKPKTPDNIRKSWLNFADLTDKVALNYNLVDDFAANKKGISPTDIIVNNNYFYHGQKNPHKVYGYLRTPQIAEVIHQFLDHPKSLWSWLFGKRKKE
jgi:hypothetical protein